MSLPPDLQVLCRRLASTAPDALPALTPALTGHILRCGGALSLPSDQKAKDSSPEASLLVHKLKTQITTLLNNGRSQPGRFAAAILIKAIIDVGGFECLRTSEPWVRGLLSIVQVRTHQPVLLPSENTSLTCFPQKNDPYPSKEIAVITLTRIYMTIHDSQTLVREIATPAIPSFVTACLQLVKAPASGKALATPLRLVETISNALCAITPLYPTTLRLFNAQIKTAFRLYMAPTASDGLMVPHSLRDTARHILILQHYTTPKNGNADEWIKAVRGFISETHATADQVFRAIQESWESNSGYVRQQVSYEGQPQGGGESGLELSTWTGLSSGSERLIGLIETLAQSLRCPTKTPVNMPLSMLLDVTARITMVLPPQDGSRSQDDTQINSAIGREEKEELWSNLPDIHTAVMDLLLALLQRLGGNAVSLASDMLYQTVRIFDASRNVSEVRAKGFVILRELLLLHGPTMDKMSVGSLDRAIQCCCKDLLAAAGFAPEQKPAQVENDPKSKSMSSNVDAYLAPKNAKVNTISKDLPAAHIAAAAALLEILPSHLPQQHLKQNLRGLIDRTAVLSKNKGAMISSVLNPFKAKSGKQLASILPFLARQFPQDQEVEVLRSNMRTGTSGSLGAVFAAEDGNADQTGEAEDETMADDEGETARAWKNGWKSKTEEQIDDGLAVQPGFGLSHIQEPVKEVTFASSETVTVSKGKKEVSVSEQVMLSSVLKRKSEEVEVSSPKRVDTGKAPAQDKMDVDEEDGEDSDSDGSIQLDGTLEDDDDDEESDS